MPVRSPQFHLVIPAGTKVTNRRDGRVGVVVHVPYAPEGAYRVHFPDGAEGSFHRADLTIFRQDQATIPDSTDNAELRRFVQYRCVVGSRAYGLAHETSDVDRRGFYLPPADLEWSLAGVPEQLESENEEVYWELEKFLRLALKANPNALECLYSPLIEYSSPIANELLAMRYIFLSQHVHRTYNAYVLSQFKKLEQDLRNQGQFRWKHVMHLIRLLLSGVTVLREGFVPLRVDEHRDRLLAIRRGEAPWTEVEQWRLALHQELDEALTATSLPEHPDYERANEFLIRARRLAYPLLFVTISGAHLYGFPSPDSDYDLRGVHLLPVREVVGLLPKEETVEVSGIREGVEIDLVTHDAGKFFSLLLKRNGYVLEQLYSPLIVQSRPEHEELKVISAKCITRHHSYHYLGFAATQWSLFTKERPPLIKPLLYVYRVLLTGIHLMRTGQVEANLTVLNQEFGLPYISDLIARKTSGAEKGTLDSADLDFHTGEYQRLTTQLGQAAAESQLPDELGARNDLHDFLVRLRLSDL